MKQDEVQKLNHGLYIVHWKKKLGGGKSLAAVGGLEDGTRWIAICNWINIPTKQQLPEVWRSIRKVHLVSDAYQYLHHD